MKNRNRLIGLYLLAVLGLLCVMCSCKSIQYVPVETVKTEVVHEHDTIRVNDSVWTEKTVTIREVDSTELAALGIKIKALQGERTAWLVERSNLQKQKGQQERVKYMYVTKTDCIQVPYPVERMLSRWEQFCLDYGKVMVGTTGVLLLSIAMIIAIWIRKRRT
jgi:hypothetical protein